MTQIVIRPADARLAGYCARGAIAAVKDRGWDWRAFVREGLPIEPFEAVDDEQFRRVAAAVRARDGQE